MSRFLTFSGATHVGYSAPEGGDPPMGTAVRRFSPSPAYQMIQGLVVAAREGSQEHLSLQIRTTDARVLDTQGGAQIIDFSAELGAEGIEVHAMGIGCAHAAAGVQRVRRLPVQHGVQR